MTVRAIALGCSVIACAPRAQPRPAVAEATFVQYERVGVKLLLVAVAVMAAGVVIGFYVSNLTTLAGSPTYSVPVHNVDGHKVVNLELQTVAAVGPKLSPNPDWVSYLIKDQSGQWKRETVWDLPAHATVHVTIYNFDGASGLRNPYLARPQGMVGNRIMVDGKPTDAIDPNDASHTFAVPALGLILAIPGVGDMLVPKSVGGVASPSSPVAQAA